MSDQVFHIASDDAGTRADAFIAAQFAVSRSRAQILLAGAHVGDRAIKPSYTLRAGDELRLIPQAIEENVEFESREFLLPETCFLWEDEAILIVNKPRGVVVHAGAGETGPTLVDALRTRGTVLSRVGPPERSGIVHRLDKDTSGVMIVAKTDVAHWNLAAQFEARTVKKRYLALVCGVPPERGRIEAPIGRHRTHRLKMAVVPEGRFALTEYEIEERWLKFAALDVNLFTGRTHQIRVHLAYLNHPVVGDALYGGFHRALQAAPNEAARLAIEALRGQALQARKIEFEHPISGERVRFEAPLAAEISAVTEALNECQ